MLAFNATTNQEFNYHDFNNMPNFWQPTTTFWLTRLPRISEIASTPLKWTDATSEGHNQVNYVCAMRLQWIFHNFNERISNIFHPNLQYDSKHAPITHQTLI